MILIASFKGHKESIEIIRCPTRGKPKRLNNGSSAAVRRN